MGNIFESFNIFDSPELELPEVLPAKPVFKKPAPVEEVPVLSKGQVVRDAVTFLKSTPAVTLVGKGGGYELLEKYAEELDRSEL